MLLYLIAIVLIVYNIVTTVNGAKNDTIEILGWVMMIIASLFAIFMNVKRVKPKDESLKE